ncbi:MAG: peptide transporter [Armatimonadetes bacterium]|nr:peptide transporter [Armatimonadota bacterium]
MDIKAELEREWGSEAFAESPEPFRDGFNLRSVVGALFLAFIMLPGSIYIGLVAGEGMGSAPQWVTVILFAEIARRSFTKLSRQEIYVLYALAGGLVSGGGPFFGLIWNQFLIQSSQARFFGIVKDLSSPVNHWIVPPLGSSALLERTFLHRDWLPAIGVLVAAQLLGRLGNFTFGYTLFRITSDLEQLPFPLAPIAAEGATALAESHGGEDSWRWRVFSIGAAIGVFFGTLYLMLPTVTGGVMNTPVTILPIPFIDWTERIQKHLPAALLGLNTNIGAVFVGFVLPFWLVVGSFISSILTHIVATPILYKYHVLHTWKPGMQTIATSVVNSLDYWMGFGVGASLVVAVLGLFLAVRTFGKSGFAPKRSGYSGASKERGDFPIPLALTLWFVSTVSLIGLCHKLVPTFPTWLLAAYGLAWTPLNSYVSARMIGLTGQGIGFPYLREASFVLSTRLFGYKGISIWFAPIPLNDWGGMTQFFKETTLTRTRITSLVKAELLVFPLLLVCSILFCGLLWKVAPVPSAAYPFAAKMWPLNAMYTCMWTTATKTGKSFILDAISWQKVTAGFCVGSTLYAVTALARLPMLLFYGMIGGIGAWPHATLLTFGGAMLGRFYFSRRFGKEQWRRYTPVLSAGFFCGMGLIGMLCVGIAMIVKSVVQAAY